MYTFTTPEAAKAIDGYLDYRKRCKEQLTDKAPLSRQELMNLPNQLKDDCADLGIDPKNCYHYYDDSTKRYCYQIW